VNFAQADILALDPSKLQFDIIECGGVLHHTADVMRSWKVLTACLKSGGLMDVALYNSRARDWLHAPRRFAQTGGYRATQKDSRRFRRDILRAPPGALPSGLAEALTKPDFYTLSMCRDAFFHIQEREFSLREILAMVERLGLQFLGLKIADAVTQQRYVERYPDDPAVRNLRYIEAQEDAMREFAGPMYMLLLQKPAAH
jgi:hypothetical protein